MRQKTTKLLHKYSTISDKSFPQLKIWWKNLNWKQRTKERKNIISELK